MTPSAGTDTGTPLVRIHPMLHPLSYAQVRRSWCLAELLRFLKQWAVYIVVGLLVLGTGASAGLSGMAGLLAWAVYPLFWAATQAQAATGFAGIALLATLVHSLLGGAVVVALRPLLWSRSWSDAESALPLSRATRRQSDLQVTLIALTPLAVVYAVGVATWLTSGAPWVVPVRFLAPGMVAASLTGSGVWGMLVLHAMRWPFRRSFQGGDAARARAKPPSDALPGSSSDAFRGVPPVPPQSAIKALLLLALWRGPAKRVVPMALTSMLAGAACGVAMLRWPGAIGWPLSAYAAISLAITTRLCTLINRDMAPLHDACAALPFRPAYLLRTRQALACLPHALALTSVCVAGWWLRADIHLTPLVGYVLVSAVVSGVVVFKTLARRAAQASYDAAWWLLMLVVMVAFASEVGQ